MRGLILSLQAAGGIKRLDKTGADGNNWGGVAVAFIAKTYPILGLKFWLQRSKKGIGID